MNSLIDNVEFRSEGLWPSISKSRLLADMQVSLNHPEDIKDLPLRGAGIVSQLVQEHPSLYVKRLRCIWENGSMYSSGTCIRSHSWMRSVQPPLDLNCDVWMMLVATQGNIVLDASPWWNQWLRQYLSEMHLRLILLGDTSDKDDETLSD